MRNNFQQPAGAIPTYQSVQSQGTKQSSPLRDRSQNSFPRQPYGAGGQASLERLRFSGATEGQTTNALPSGTHPDAYAKFYQNHATLDNQADE